MTRTWTVALVAGLALLALAGCGAADDGDSPTSDPGTTPAATSLTIELTESPTGPSTTTTLTCDPAGGTHADPAAACAAIVAAGGASAFDPVPPGTACTEIWGGPQTATVEGTVDGQVVRADFSRENGCEIARWDRLAVVLGSTGGVR